MDMSKRRLVRSCLLSLVLLIALAMPRMVSAQGPDGSRVVNEPFEGVLSQSCLGEPVAIEGSATFHFHTVTTPQGRVLIVDHFNVRAAGIGLESGTRYHYSSVSSQVGSFVPVPESGTFTLLARSQLVARGSGDNLIALFTVHATQNANGVVTVFFEVAESNCRG